jgi:hypothetical protein
MMVFTAICALLSCRRSVSDESKARTPDPGTIKVILYHEAPGVSYKDKVGFKRNLAYYLGLPLLTGGYRGLRVRVWVRDSTDTTWVIDIKKNSAQCGCTILSYTVRKMDSLYYIDLHQQKEYRPKSGWIDFFNELVKYHVPEMEEKTLPEDREASFTSMTYVQFEIDEPNEYHYVEYPDPLLFENEDKASKIIDEFFRYFNQEMGTTIYDSRELHNAK